MSKSIEEITEEYPIIQEYDKFLKANNLDQKDSLLLRGVRHSIITSIQNKQDMSIIRKSTDKCHEILDKSPSISQALKLNFWKTSGQVVAVYLILFTIFYTIATLIGLADFILLALP